jgi:transcription antitermination protein NusB
VVISEYVDIAHRFYDEDEPGLVNGVLDALAREVREGELDARKSAPTRARKAR